MKILLVSRFFPYIGGREVLVMLLASKLSKNHQVVLATPDIGRVSKDYEIISNNNESLFKCFKDFKPDVVNSHTFYLTPDLFELTNNNNVPLILTIHGDIFGFGSESDKKMLEVMLPRLDMTVAVCEQGKEQLLQNGADPSKLNVIYPGIATEMFSGQPLDKEVIKNSFQLPLDKFVFITPARMTRYKGIEVLLEAIGSIDIDIRSRSLFWITTPATRYRTDELSYTNELLKKAASLGIKDNVQISFCDFASMPFAYKAADAFILPSLTEQFPVTILEAMASRLPVIATNVGGVSEIINEHTGELINPGDSVALARVITKIYPSRNEAALNSAQMTVVENFGADRMVDEYTNLYKSLVK